MLLIRYHLLRCVLSCKRPVLLLKLLSLKGVCDDCTEINQCPQAMKLAARERSHVTLEKLRNATCSIDKGLKICCLDFLADQLVGTENVDDEIENHPNIQLLPNECGKIASYRLLGGRNSSPYDFPWLVLIAIKVSGNIQLVCEGTLINSKYVLTTAHCIKNKNVVGVRVGDYNIRTKIDCFGYGDHQNCEAKYQDIRVEYKISHEDYGLHPVPLNDIGLLRLRTPVDFSVRTVGAICLPIYRNHRETDLYAYHGTVAGWNIIQHEITSDIILKTPVSIHKPETCRTYLDRYQKINSEIEVKHVLCAEEMSFDSCIEGEGAPLMVEREYDNIYKYIQYGIKSQVPFRCGTNLPRVYIDVRRFMKWILDSINP